MDRGGGRGRGGPSRQGSSLPQTLHGSLIHTGSQEPSDVFTEEPPPAETIHHGDIPFTTFSARPPRASSTAPPSFLPAYFEEGSSRDVGGPSRGPVTSYERGVPQGQARTEAPPAFLPPIHRAGVPEQQQHHPLYSSTAPPAPASGSPNLYNYHQRSSGSARLPSVRSLAPPSRKVYRCLRILGSMANNVDIPWTALRACRRGLIGQSSSPRSRRR